MCTQQTNATNNQSACGSEAHNSISFTTTQGEKMDIEKALEAFRARVEADQIARCKAEGFRLELHLTNLLATLKIGKKYAKVDVGRSGRYMVDMATGEIFGIKGYGVIHKGHRFGTLDTIEAYNWGGYSAHRLTVKEA